MNPFYIKIIPNTKLLNKVFKTQKYFFYFLEKNFEMSIDNINTNQNVALAYNYKLLAEAIKTKNFENIRRYAQSTEMDNKKLLLSISDAMCNKDIEKKHLIDAFVIYSDCRDLLCDEYNENIDMEKVFYWSSRIIQDFAGNFYMV